MNQPTLIDFEFQKSSPFFKRFSLYLPFIHLINLAFFAMIRHIELSHTNDILHTNIGVLSLANTLTLSIFSIYITWIIGKRVLVFYIGQTREKTYSYPSGKDALFVARLQSFILPYIRILLISFITINSGFYFLDNLLTGGELSLLNYIIIILLCCLATLSSTLVVFLALCIGFHFQSNNNSLISSVILVALIGNVVASTYNVKIELLLLIIVALFGSQVGLIRWILRHVKKDYLF